MFDSDLERAEGSVVRRRAFLFASASAPAGAILWSLRRPSPVQAGAAKGTSQGPSEEVTIVEFSDSGERFYAYRRWSKRRTRYFVGDRATMTRCRQRSALNS
jgi:hypothetical protein